MDVAAPSYCRLGDAAAKQSGSAHKSYCARPTYVTNDIACCTQLHRNLRVSFDLVEERSRIVLEQVCEEIETATMGHS
jgi:hypothetical protein